MSESEYTDWNKWVLEQEKMITENISDATHSTDEEALSKSCDEDPIVEGPLQKIIRNYFSAKKNDVGILRMDLISSQYSEKGFEALNSVKGSFNMDINTLAILLGKPPQKLRAQPGPETCKTEKIAAFILAILMEVNPNENFPQVLCIFATHELAIQTGEVTAEMAKYCPGIKLRYAVKGDEPCGSRIEEQVVIGTPDIILNWAIKINAFDWKKIRVILLWD